MEAPKTNVNLQILHFNDAYEVENTPLFTADLLSKERGFIKQNTPQLLEENGTKRSRVDLSYEHTETFGVKRDVM